jgi:hypothetical protein
VDIEVPQKLKRWTGLPADWLFQMELRLIFSTKAGKGALYQLYWQDQEIVSRDT